jgi:hypothetical protein
VVAPIASASAAKRGVPLNGSGGAATGIHNDADGLQQKVQWVRIEVADVSTFCAFLHLCFNLNIMTAVTCFQNGCGIPAAAQSVLFYAFRQIEAGKRQAGKVSTCLRGG